MSGMRRREFVSLLGGGGDLASCGEGAAVAGKVPTIGFLGPNTPTVQRHWTAVFVQRLRELGWIEGRNIAIEYRSAVTERFAEDHGRVRSAEGGCYRHGGGTPPSIAAKQATSDIPIVFAASADPVGTGLVASLARPGGNVTGLSKPDERSWF